MRHLKYLFIGLFCFITSPATAVFVGQPVENFRLRDLNGAFHSDTDYRGKVLILAIIGYN